MTRAVFVDTSAWYALADSGDTHHVQAEQRLRRLLRERRTLLTSNHVAGETYTLLRVRLGYRAAQEFLRRTRNSAFVQRVFVPESWEETAEDLLVQYDDQDFSYVDATSFVAMRRLGLQDTFAFDHHFAIPGFALVADEG
ncbi:MAG: PIN domain-containing protein [Chloroflexi bacterium]|nr:PIN domain-containing protein [Chloroflexota bacterium]